MSMSEQDIRARSERSRISPDRCGNCGTTDVTRHDHGTSGLALLVCVGCEARTHLDGDAVRLVATAGQVREYAEILQAEFDRVASRWAARR